MGCIKPKKQEPASYSNQLSTTLSGQSSAAPQQLALERQYQPEYMQLALENYEQVAPRLTDQRFGNLDTALGRAPQVTSAIRSLNPQSQELLGELNTQVLGDLRSGGNLSPEQTRQMQQASRGAFAARGMSGGNQAIFDEGFRQYDLGNRLQQQRQAAAGGVLGLNQQQVDAPALGLLQNYMQAANNPQESFALMQSAGPSLFNPESNLSAQITSGNRAAEDFFNWNKASGGSLGQFMSSY